MDMRVSLEPGEKGTASVKRFTVSEDDARWHNLRTSIRDGRTITAGDYTSLSIKGVGLVMSDTPYEQHDHRNAVRNATDHVLINGLGIGMVVAACLKKPEVLSVTVIEINQDVIDLVVPQIVHEKLTVICADALTWKPPRGNIYGMVWHDIWPTICADNLPDMAKLKRKYARRAAWQGCWCERECRSYARRRY